MTTLSQNTPITTPLNKEQQSSASTPQKKIVIAIDGPAASGKSTLAKILSERLGYAFLDTGALYRAVAFTALAIGADPSNYAEVAPALDIVKRNITPELLANPELHSHDVSDAASKVAALPDVRIELIDFQREFANNPPGNVGGAVLVGRDIGTVICPNADMKFFVTASATERARRRFMDLQKTTPSLTEEMVLEDVVARDQRDSTRKTAPTLRADDAYILDTTELKPTAVVDEAVALISSKFIAETAF